MMNDKLESDDIIYIKLPIFSSSAKLHDDIKSQDLSVVHSLMMPACLERMDGQIHP